MGCRPACALARRGPGHGGVVVATLRQSPTDYSDVIDAAYVTQPASTPLPEVVTTGGPARRLRDACEPVALHDAAAAALPHAQLVLTRDEATVASLRDALGAEDPSEVADLLATAAQDLEGAGRPLFTGLLQRGQPSDPVHRLWWACDLVREHRGDSHVAAANVAGLGPVEMNLLTELWLGMPLFSYTATRGWSPEAMQESADSLAARGLISGEELTESGRALRASVEAATDAQEQSVVDALGSRLDGVCAQLDQWGERCVEAGAFTPDILKRAAG